MPPPRKKQGGQFLVYVSEEKARQDIEKFGGLSTNELLVYQVVFFISISRLLSSEKKNWQIWRAMNAPASSAY